jgi:30S ribosomal protein 3
LSLDAATHASLSVWRAQAEATEAVEEVDAGEEESEDWAANKLAALEAADASVVAEAALYSLNFLWLEKNIGVAVDQVFGRGQRSPVTEFFFWPRKDAWEELKASLEGKAWIGEREKVLLLNQCTEVINYWQDETKHSLSEAQEKFPDCKLQGS